jgi:peptidoglycan hydrolase-like protein with peptidoglycan-binding domain
MSVLLRQGSTGANVRHLQNELNFLKMANPPLVVDGIFGPKTRAAVLNFQRSMFLKDDGIAGPITLQTLVARVFQSLFVSV